MQALYLAAAGFLSWTVSSLTAGGGSVLFIALLALIVESRAVAPIVTLASLIAAPLRMAVFWPHIDWRLVRWYVPGGVLGALAGGWMLAWLPAAWIDVAVGLFLVSTPLQYRFGDRPRAFRMPLPAFVPLSFAVGLISALVGASGLVASPFYLNYGLIKESLLATRAVNSLAIQVTKMVAYLQLGAFGPEALWQGAAAGAGAALAIAVSLQLLAHVAPERFRRLSVLMMALTGLHILWRRRDLLLAPFT
jgi:hypothetical protein